jgi:hypothetical protein
MTPRILCPYCQTSNSTAERLCLSCGAPLPLMRNDSKPFHSTSRSDSRSDNLIPSEQFHQKLREICERHEDRERCHTSNTYSFKNFERARRHFRIPHEDKVILIFDNSVFGSNKFGFAISEKGIYWKNGWYEPTRRRYLSWEKFAQRKIRPRPDDYCINLTRKDNISISFTEDIQPMADLLEEIQALIKSENRDATEKMEMTK